MGRSLAPADPNAPLGGAFDVERAVATTPAAALTKGMFFAPLRADIGAAWDALVPKLDAPPRLGRYVPFADYASRDHVRLIDAAARARFPYLAPREAHRRLGRASFAAFEASTFGRVALQLLSQDIGTVLKRFGDGYAMLVKRTRPVRSELQPDGSVHVLFVDPLALPEYVLGILEAIILRGERTPRVTVRLDSEGTHFDVRWT